MTIIYNKYSLYGMFLGERIYRAKDAEDLERALQIIEQNPNEYELVNIVD